MNIKDMYYDVGNAVKGVCDRVYAHDRPKAVSDRPGSYIVVVFPSVISIGMGMVMLAGLVLFKGKEVRQEMEKNLHV